MTGTSFNLAEHLRKEHKISPLQTYLKEIVYGGNDGIVTTFAVIAGFTGAQTGNITTYSYLAVMLFGLANLFADGASMGLGNFLSLRSEKDVYNAEEAKELHEIRTNPKMEKEETFTILKEKGFTTQDAKELTNIYSKNEKYWVQFMMNHELELPNPRGENPVFTGLATLISFVSFGFIPLIPYIFLANNPSVFLFSSASSLLALILLGMLRWRITAESMTRSVLEIVGVGSTAAFIAYVVGTFFTL